jgi:RNA-directed DNA polymerase
MKELSRKYKFTYSRYADDLCVSSNTSAPPSEVCELVGDKWVAGAALRAVVEQSGFSINEDKTKFRSKFQRQMITGLVANEKVGMPREWRRQLRVLLHLREKHGPEAAMKIVKTWSRNSVRRRGATSVDPLISGKAGFAYHLERSRTPSFTLSLFRAYPGAREIIANPYESFPVSLYTEGKTDGAHLMSAHRFFKTVGKFSKLNISLANDRVISGSPDLLSHMARLSKTNPNQLTVGVLDCDEPALMAREGLEPGGFKRLGGAIYVMCLGRPSHVAEGQVFCIEDLYDWEEASKFDQDERRLFKKAEFDEFGVHVSGRYETDPDTPDSIYITGSVKRIGDGHSALLSKTAFAGYVRRQEFPFKNIGFYGFSPTFSTLVAIVRDHLGRLR